MVRLVHELAAGAVLFGGLCLLRSEYERDQLVTERYVIHSPKVRGKGRTFVFLSDLHDKEFGEENRRLLEAVRWEKPDAVLAGGDMMVAKGKGDLTVSLNLLGALAAEFTVYCGNGNHEGRLRQEPYIYGSKYRDYKEELQKLGIIHLENAGVKIGEDMILYGLDLPLRCYRPGNPKMRPDFVKHALGEADKERFSILLAHSPMFFKEYAEWGADLTLSGHFHGGTIRLPFFGGVMTPQYQFFYPWCAGDFREGEKEMIVSRGLGTHSVNIRLNNKPQVVVVEVRR